MVLMEIMNPLKKLSSKFGGLLKLAMGTLDTGLIDFAETNEVRNKALAQKTSVGPNAGVTRGGSATYADFSKMSPEDKMHLALDNPNFSLRLDPGETYTYNKLPESNYTYSNPYTGPKVPMVNSDGTPFQNSTNPEQYVQNPTDYKTLGTGPTGYLRSPNSLESGTTGILRRFTPNTVDVISGNMPKNYDSDTARQLGDREVPGVSWYELQRSNTSISRDDARRMNSPYAFKKDTSKPYHHSNATTVRTLGDGSKQFTDPFLNRQNYLKSRRQKALASASNPYTEPNAAPAAGFGDGRTAEPLAHPIKQASW